jgi:hypothetical protein
MPNTSVCWAKPDFPWGLDTTGNPDYSGLMTYYRAVAYHEIPDRYAAQTLAMAEALYADEPMEDDEDMPDEDRYVSEADYFAPTAQDHADLAWVLDWEAFEGFGS